MSSYPTFAERIRYALPSRHRMRSTATPAPVGSATPAHTHPFSDILFSGLTAGTFLKATGLTTVAFTALAASDIQSGILPVPRGGTGIANVPFHSVLLGDDTNPLIPLANSSGAVRYLRSSAVGLVTWGQVAYSELTGTPSSFPPAAHTHPLSDLTGGIEAGDYVRYNGAQWARSGPGVSAAEIIGNTVFGSFGGVATESFAFHSTVGGHTLHFGDATPAGGWSSSYNAIELGDRSAIMYRVSDSDIYMLSNAYYDGANYRYRASQPAVYYRWSGAAGNHRFLTAASGTAGDVISWSDRLLIPHSGSIQLGAPLDVAYGGTGIASPVFGAVLIGNDTLAMTSLVNSSGGVRFLRSSAVGAVTWGQVAYSELTGTPPSFPPAAHTHPLSDLTGGIEAGDHIRYNGAQWIRKGPDIGLVATGRLYLDDWTASTGHTYFHEASNDIVDVIVGGFTMFRFRGTATVFNLSNVPLAVGAGDKIYFDATGTTIGNTYIQESTADRLILVAGGVAAMSHDTAGSWIPAGAKFGLDGTASTDTYLRESSANLVDAYAGGVNVLRWQTGQVTSLVQFAVPSGVALYFDNGSDTYWQEAAANRLRAVVGGNNALAIELANGKVHTILLQGALPHATHSGYNTLYFGGSNNIMFRDGTDWYYLTNAYYDGTWKRSTGSQGAMLYQMDNAQHLWYTAASGSADSTITWNEKLRITETGVLIPAGVILYFDGGSNTGMRETSSDVLDIIVGGGTRAGFKSAVVEIYTDLVVSGQMRSNQTTISVASGDTTKTVDFSTGNQHVLSMSNTASCAITLSNMATGGWYSIELLAVSGTRSYSITNTLKVLSGSVGASLAVDKRKLILFYYDGTHIMTVAHADILAA